VISAYGEAGQVSQVKKAKCVYSATLFCKIKKKIVGIEKS
jgi:hypothetical protein